VAPEFPLLPICTCLPIPHPTSSKGVNARYFERVWLAEQTHNHSPECGMALSSGLGTGSAPVQLELETHTTIISPQSPIVAPPDTDVPPPWSLDTLLLEPRPRVRRIRVPPCLLPRQLAPADEAPPPPMPPEGRYRDPIVPLPPGCTCKRISISPGTGFEGLGGYIDRVMADERDHVHSPWCVQARATGDLSTWSPVRVQHETPTATATNEVPPIRPTTPSLEVAPAVDHATTEPLQSQADTELALEAEPLLPADAALAATEPLQSHADAALSHETEPLQSQGDTTREPLQSQTDTSLARTAELLQSHADAALVHETEPLQSRADAAREPLQSKTDAALALEAKFLKSHADASLARETEPRQSQADATHEPHEVATDATMGQTPINPRANASDADNKTADPTDPNTTSTPEAIIDELMTRTIRELRERLKERGLSSNGPKHTLAVRLAGAT